MRLNAREDEINGAPLDDIEEPFVAEEFSLDVLGFRDSVGDDDDALVRL
jgi:hypothetical protein